MDWTGMMRDAWRIMRRASALWGLGIISVLQAGLYGFIIVGLIVPLTALTQLLVELPTAPSSPVGNGASSFQGFLSQAVSWIQRWEPVLLTGVVAIVVLWAALGVLDVAATAGAISQTSNFAEGRGASVRGGMRDGFGIWWRTVGLLAIAALPSLLYLLAIAAFTLFTISIPLTMGVAPDLGAMRSGNALNGVLSMVVGLVGVPLGVLVQLGLRYAVVEHREWRAALSSAWRLARENLGEVALMYLLQVGVTAGVAVALSIVLGILLAVAGIGVGALVAVAHTFSGAAMFVTVIALLLAMVLGLAGSIAILVWVSVAWTLFWRRMTGRDPLRIQPDTRPAETSTNQVEAL